MRTRHWKQRQAERHANVARRWLWREVVAPKAKQESTNLPLSIWARLRLVLMAIFAVVGFCMWGWPFVWVALGVIFCRRALRFVLGCVCFWGFIWFIFKHLL